MSEKFSEYLKDLPPELQEKAKNIKTMEELNEFLSENDIELPEDALEAVSGGCGEPWFYEEGTIFRGCCPDCGGDLEYVRSEPTYDYRTRTVARCLKTKVQYVYMYDEWRKC